MANILEHRWTANIAAILGALSAIVVPIGLYVFQKSDTTGSKADTGSHWTGAEIFLIIIVCIQIGRASCRERV